MTRTEESLRGERCGELSSGRGKREELRCAARGCQSGAALFLVLSGFCVPNGADTLATVNRRGEWSAFF